MLYTVPLMALALLGTAVCFGRGCPLSHHTTTPHYVLTAELTRDTGGILVPGTDYPRPQALSVLVAMMLFVAAYATGSGNIPWQQGELFPLEVRGLGTSLCTATNWSCNLLVAATFLTLMEAVTPTGTFALYALVCVLGWVFVWRCYPETSGLSLEEVTEVFADDFGVEKSLQMRKAKYGSRV